MVTRPLVKLRRNLVVRMVIVMMKYRLNSNLSGADGWRVLLWLCTMIG